MLASDMLAKYTVGSETFSFTHNDPSMFGEVILVGLGAELWCAFSKTRVVASD